MFWTVSQQRFQINASETLISIKCGEIYLIVSQVIGGGMFFEELSLSYSGAVNQYFIHTLSLCEYWLKSLSAMLMQEKNVRKFSEIQFVLKFFHPNSSLTNSI